MSHDFLQDARFYALLTHIDQDLARNVQAGGCTCGGRLNVANYPRKPRGPVAIDFAGEWDTRLSFCCATEGCRQRATPPSVRFLGRKVYVAVVVVLASITSGGRRLGEQAALVLNALVISERTLRRWVSWWRRTFVATDFWRRRRGLVMPPPNESELPGSLLACFTGPGKNALISLLKFISPLTTESVHAM